MDNGFSLKASIDANLYTVSTHDSVSKTGYSGQRFELSSLLSLNKQLAGRINLNLMIRQDMIDNKFIAPIPYLGFDLRLMKDDRLVLKGNVAGNYHHPSLNDLYWEPGGNPDLLPEKGYSYELGLQYRSVFAGNILESGFTAYRSDIQDWIIWIPSFRGYWEPQNIDRVLSQGIEAVSYTHLRAHET